MAFTETVETEQVLDARFGRLAELAAIADEIERQAELVVRALRNIPEHGSVTDALAAVRAVAMSAKSGSPRAKLSEALATALRLTFDHAEAEGATYLQMGEAATMAGSNVYKYRTGGSRA